LTLSRRESILRTLKALASAGIVPQLHGQEHDGLAVLGERIVPGSAAASCSRVIDLILSTHPPDTRQKRMGAVEAFDREGQARFGKPFATLNAENQDALLLAASQPNDALHPAFQLVKGWVADTYWSSQAGMRARGSNGRMAWESYPACAAPAKS
jgi:hypothetical protein